MAAAVKITAQDSQSWAIQGYLVSAREILGRGAYGVVYAATKEQEKKIAAKSINGKLHPRILNQDLNKLLQLDHPNVIKIFDFFRENDTDDFWMFMELCKLGDLNKYFEIRDVSQEQKIEIMKQITTGVKYLHENNIIHRDIKPGNILVANDIPLSLKLTDFDFSKFLEDDQETSAMTSNVGTNAYKAPEFYQRQEGKLLYRRHVDVYACGLTFLAILQSKRGKALLVPHLETADDQADLINPIASTIVTRMKYNHKNLNIVKIEDPSHASSAVFLQNEIRKLIEKMTCVNPHDRMSALDVLHTLHDLDQSEKTTSVTMTFFGDGSSWKVPKTWTWKSMHKTSQYALIKLAPTDNEYIEVSQEFLKTCSRNIIMVCMMLVLSERTFDICWINRFSVYFFVQM